MKQIQSFVPFLQKSFGNNNCTLTSIMTVLYNLLNRQYKANFIYDIIEKNAGGTYSYKGKKLCRGEEKFQKLLEEDDDLRRKLLRRAEINTIGTTRKQIEALGDVNYFPVDGVEYESQKDEEEDYEEEE